MSLGFGQQALTIVLPVRSGQGAALERLLETRCRAVCEKLATIAGLHAGRFVVLPATGSGERAGVARSDLLLFESNFDGEAEEHLGALVRELGEELTLMLEHCDGGTGERASVASRLRAGSRRASVFFSAHAGRSVRRVLADARIRAALSSFLRAERARLRSESPLAIVERARSAVASGDDGGSLRFDEPTVSASAVTRPAAPAHAAALRLVGFFPWLARAAVQDLLDIVRELWTDAKLDRTGLEERLARIALREGSNAQQALTHVSEVKPGGFRRRALRRALMLVDRWVREAPAGARLLGASHFARWVELGDGRLVFLSHHDGSFEAEMGRFVERASFLASLVWSHTRDFPAGLSACFGGARDEANFKDWAQVKRVPTPIVYSAYPGLALADVERGAELRAILNAKLDEPAARRALDLV